jgi:hypothetical protein
MRYEINNQSVTFFLDNPKRAEEIYVSQSFAGSSLTEQQVIPLAESLVKKYRGQSLSAQQGTTTAFLRPFFAYFREKGRSLFSIVSLHYQYTDYWNI